MKKKTKKKIDKIINKLDNFINWSPPKILVGAILFIFSLLITFMFFKLDNDFWFIVNTGKYIINNGFPTIEPFTIHTDLAFIVQQWLTDVIFYFIYNKLDVYGMLILVTIINIIITMLMYKISMLISENKVKLSIFITMLLSILLSSYFITTRPQIFDVLFLLLEIYLLELYIKKNNKLYLLGLPIISLFMINLHSSIWFMLFIFLLPYFVDRVVKIKCFDNEKYNIKNLFIITIIMALVGLINPYGIDAITYIFNSYGIEYINELVNEMKPLTVETINGIVIFIYILIILFSYYRNKKEKIKLRYLLLFLGTCYLGLSHYKGILFLLVGGILSIIYNFKDIVIDEKKQENLYSNNKKNIFVIVSIVLIIGLYTGIILNINLKYNNKNYLEDIVDYLDDISDNKDVKVYTGYNDGGYLEYRGYKCYLDPRAEVFLKGNNKKEDILLEYTDLQDGKLNYKEFLSKYDFDYLIVSDEDLLYTYISSEDGYIYMMEKAITNFYSDNVNKYRLYKKVK